MIKGMAYLLRILYGFLYSFGVHNRGILRR